jgi:hypothetical protein
MRVNISDSKLVRVRVVRVSVVSIINYTLHHAFAHTHTLTTHSPRQ